ncbi:MAG: 4-alpha-glucanotransferase [Candidatus Binatia bacterium]|nr:MAG: 4-alpha-glucanotransferase [Candidatus Binatia bacterium]
MRLPRASGVLLHPTSLPSPYGIGDLGPAARQWVDALARAGQRWWQVLPLGPTGFGDSPYQCFSAFAGNPWLISPEDLAAEGLLEPADYEPVPSFTPGRVDFGRLIPWKRSWLARAAERLQTKSGEIVTRYHEFRQRSGWWLEDYALFSALKDAFGGAVWSDWDVEVVRRDAATLARWRERLAGPIEMYRAWQFFFFDQWHALRRYAHARDVHLIGDVPIFVAYDSADVWVHPELFFLDENRKPTVVAGVPPDYFSATGQLWGNPLYRWDRIAADGYRWWVDRVREALKLVDLVRIDHFIGFVRYWEIPAGAPTAVTGRYVPGPGADFLSTLQRSLGGLPLVAEDLGAVTPEVDALREQFQLPGMKVLQFAFSSDAGNRFLPHNYSPNFIVYTGTHDNDTTVGWFRSAPASERRYARRYLGRSGKDIAWDLIRLGMSSVADTFVVPAQDLLSLGSEARMNYPGRPEGNWSWQLQAGQLTEAVWERLRELTETYGRLTHGQPPASGTR